LPSVIPPTISFGFYGITRKYVLVDSILLLLLAVGLWNPRAIATQKRLHGLTFDDFQVLRNFLSTFQTIVTTAHVLTEVSNLAGSASGQTRTAVFAQLSSLIETLDERSIPAVEIIGQPEFHIFGLTDAVLSRLCPEMLLLTEDGRLATHLILRGMHAMSLSQVKNLRTLANNV